MHPTEESLREGRQRFAAQFARLQAMQPGSEEAIRQGHKLMSALRSPSAPRDLVEAFLSKLTR